MDDGCSWLFQGSDMHRYDASCDSAGPHHKQEEQEVNSSQAIQQQLSQIYMLMDMEEHEYAAAPPHRASLPSSSSSSFRSFSGSRDDNSSLMLTAASTTTSSHHPLEVSSQIPLSPPIACGDAHHQYSSHEMIPNLEFTYQEAQQEQARDRIGHESTVRAATFAFRPYSRYLVPKKKVKPGACGQRAIKTVMSILSRMHMARLAQYYQMEMAAQAQPSAPAGGSNRNQLQHVLSERKRRDKLNYNFKALRTVLPPASKKDKASILMRAKDYVNTLKSRVSELEEKNRMLVESQHHHDDDDDGGGRQDDGSDDGIEVDISRSAAEISTLVCQEFHLKIVIRSRCSVMDAVVGILQCLKERGNASLVAMNIDSSSSCLPPAKTFPRATVTFQLKSSSCDEDFLKESVIKTLKDVMQSEKATP